METVSSASLDNTRTSGSSNRPVELYTPPSYLEYGREIHDFDIPATTTAADILCDIFNGDSDNFMSSLAQEKTSFLDILHSTGHEPKLLQLSDEHNIICMENPTDFRHLKLPLLEQEPEPNQPEDVSSKKAATKMVAREQPSVPCSFKMVRKHAGDTEPECYSAAPLEQCGNLSAASEAGTVTNCMEGLADSTPVMISDATVMKGGLFNNEGEQSDSTTNAKDAHPSKKPRVCKGNEEVKSGQRMTHIAVERNRRKQMNEHLAILRSLMPGSYVQRGDQASIIGGVVEFVKELQQLLQSLEAQKQRRTYAEALSPRLPLSPRASPSPRLPPASPRHSLSPRSITSSPARASQQIRPNLQIASYAASAKPADSASYTASDNNINGVGSFESVRDLVAKSRSALAEVEVKLAGSNVLLRTLSQKAPGQLLEIVTALENLCLQILHLNITTVEETVLYAFTLKIKIECRLSVDDLAAAVQQIFREIHSGHLQQ